MEKLTMTRKEKLFSRLYSLFHSYSEIASEVRKMALTESALSMLTYFEEAHTNCSDTLKEFLPKFLEILLLLVICPLTIMTVTVLLFDLPLVFIPIVGIVCLTILIPMYPKIGRYLRIIAVTVHAILILNQFKLAYAYAVKYQKPEFVQYVTECAEK